MNKLYVGPQVKIGERSAFKFMVIYVCLIFSVGIPFLYPIGMLYFTIIHMLEKYQMLRFYSKTKEFDQEMPIR